MNALKSKHEIILERLSKEGKVTVVSEEKTAEIIEKATKAVEEYRFLNQQRIRKSQASIATVILTA